MIGRGTIFRHMNKLDPDWTPGPGQKYAGAPKALCRVTKVELGQVYYRIGTDPGKAHYKFPLEAASLYVKEVL